MKTSVELQPVMSFLIWWILIGLVLLALVILAQVIFRNVFAEQLREAKRKHKLRKIDRKSLPALKGKYLNELGKIDAEIKSGRITIRRGYQKLSRLIRKFANEATGINVDKYTLAEINMLGMPQLTRLVAEYYEPEFARYTKADINVSLQRTKGVIERWS